MQQDSHIYPSAVADSPSASNGGSLFNADEVRFMDDSLSNADSFDPFTIGAPGFKVPTVLPANLGGIGSMPRDVDPSSSASMGRGNASWPDRGEQQQAFSNGVSSQQQQQQSQYKRQSHSPVTNIRGGYGRDKAWQMQQLEALQAESERYRNNQTQTQVPEDELPSTMPDFINVPRTGSTLPALNGDLSWLQQDSSRQNTSIQLPFQNGSYSNTGLPSSSSTHAQMPTSSQDLSHLGLQFPSSHNFAAASGSDETSSKRQRRSKDDEVDSMACDGDSGPRRGRSPNARPPWTQPPDLSKVQVGRMSLPLSSQQTGQASTSSASTTMASISQRAPINVDFDAPYTYLPAPKPPPNIVDLSKLAGKGNAIPPQLSDAFFAPNMARYQPHLVLLRQEQMKRKEQGLSANIRKGDKKAHLKQDQGSPDIGTEVDGEKKKIGHTLLTEAEKKANHIASEQKRRANIRKGYELLCDLVPALREDGEGGDGSEEGMEEDDDVGEEDEVKRGKRRRGYETSGGGERIEGRTGPRSEAAILMAAVEHLRGQLEVHKQLVEQKQEAQLRVAQRFGLDIRAEPSKSTTSSDAKKR